MASGYCDAHRPRSPRSDEAREWDALYNNRAWKRYRRVFLFEHPLCCDPFQRHKGMIVAANVVDHAEAHRGDLEKFWNPANHRALCGPCNSFKCAKYEGGFGNPRG